MNSSASKLRIGVLRGGPSAEYEVSLKTGQNILNQLDPDNHVAYDILISKEGDWHLHGLPRKPEKIIKHLDLVLNGLHGEYGENGQVQRLLETFQVPYSGAKSLPSAIAMNKMLAKRQFAKLGLNVPRDIFLRQRDLYDNPLHNLIDELNFPIIVKPVRLGSSVGMNIARDYDELREAIHEALRHEENILLEEYIPGREATVGVIDNFRNDKIYQLPPVEIIPPPEKSWFDYDAKYSGQSQEICPGNFSRQEGRDLQALATQAHNILGLRHYSRSDFIITPQGKIYILETNSLPGLTEESLFPKALGAVGSSVKEFVHHLINLTIEKNVI